jgi:hypothetical protein
MSVQLPALELPSTEICKAAASDEIGIVKERLLEGSPKNLCQKRERNNRRRRVEGGGWKVEG